MSAAPPRVFTIAPDRPFLETLARAVLDGFPCADAGKPGFLDLPRWTILLPTRRAVRELEDIFFRLHGGHGLLLPRIRPIGDIDEDLLDVGEQDPGEEEPLSAPGQLLLLVDLIDRWAADHPDTPLAREIASAPHQALGLAQSLAEMLETLGTEEVDPARLPELYGLEAARHREAILQFLGIARDTYPQRLASQSVVSPHARRSRLLRREAERLSRTATLRPFIAAGSTGSIPATAALLKAISRLPNGAVVLPGLDQLMDEPSWLAVEPTHPQFALKNLIATLGTMRGEVKALEEFAAAPTPRQWLISEIMRPAGTSHLWRDALARRREDMPMALDGLELVETRSLQEQALTAALILRQALEIPGRTGCLITPDRQLARRVKAELRRWDIAIDDSAGEPLIRHGAASLLNLVLEGLLDGFGPASLAALMRHDLARFGQQHEAARLSASIIELTLFRAAMGAPSLDRLSHALRLARETGEGLHPLLRNQPDEAWEAAALHAARIVGVLVPLATAAHDSLADWLDALAQACEAIAGETFWDSEGGAELAEAFAMLRKDSRHLAQCDLARAAAIIRTLLQGIAVRPQSASGARLSILGLLEARLIRSDVVVLAGLNEGTWPGRPDTGPWINRPMRDILGLKQPESQIGQTAHDFAQALGGAEVKLLWARRIGDAPATPSRWIHRLQMILATAGLSTRAGKASRWPVLARSLVEPKAVTPCAMPQPRPPVALRPRRLSVTQVETLIRDPYAIYARRILRLVPVDPIATAPDPRRRGTIFHQAIGDFLSAYPADLPQDIAAQLLRLAEDEFAKIEDFPDLVSFWRPRFIRIARWFADNEPDLRTGVVRVMAERDGALEFPVAGQPFTLTGRADRIDLLTDGSARIIDYKTGTPPSGQQVESGLAPQLTLEAAMLARGAFPDLGSRETRELDYIQLSGGEPAGKIRKVAANGVMDLAEEHFAGLLRLLTAFSSASHPYAPRTVMEKESEESDYDHLSRFREWSLSGSRR